MTTGQRILLARKEAGLSQRQLAGDRLTRNMLSSLEHDTANPSLATLRYLSERLHKPVSYFLGEDQPRLTGYETLEAARGAFDGGQFRRCLDLLAGEAPGPALEREWTLLQRLAALALAEQAIADGRLPYARELLKTVLEAGAHPYFPPELTRKARILAAKCPENPGDLPRLAAQISGDDDALLIFARAALAEDRPGDAARYLAAARDQSCPEWNRLMGECHFARQDYRSAAECYHRAEHALELRARLEVCYRELEDYKMAYFYAKK